MSRLLNPYITKASSYKGQMHQHTWNSDGAGSPEEMLNACIAAGYDWSVISDHNFFTTPTNNNPNDGTDPLVPYCGRYPHPWVEGEDYALDEYSKATPNGVDSYKCIQANTASLDDKPGTGVDWETYWVVDNYQGVPNWTTPVGILWIPAVEETLTAGHIVNFDAETVAMDALGNPLQTVVDVITAQTGTDGQRPLISMAHPNRAPYEITDVELLDTTGYDMIEVSNGLADDDADDKIDTLLSTGRKVWLTAVSDAHNFEDVPFLDPNNTDPNSGFIVTYSDSLTITAIKDAIRTGNFYASAGPTGLTFGTTGNRITAVASENSTFEFIGLNGSVLKTTTSATSAFYDVTDEQGYVRITITQDSDSKRAWSQPFFLIPTIKVWGESPELVWGEWDLGANGAVTGDYGSLGFTAQGVDSWATSPVFAQPSGSGNITLADTPITAGYALWIRGSAAVFESDDVVIAWELYSGVVEKTWNYTQLRISYF